MFYPRIITKSVTGECDGTVHRDTEWFDLVDPELEVGMVVLFEQLLKLTGNIK